MPKKLLAALNYNENKLKQGKATCIYSANYLRTAQDMNFYQKLEGLERRNELNDRATTKTLHVSLNFDPSENYSSEKLIRIASEYMQKIGFEEQPYLIYKHFDAGHPHVHIVSTTILEDVSRINTHNIGRNQSEKARKELEVKYGLIKAEDQKRSLKQKIHAISVERVMYGKAETKKGITTVVNAVFNTYKYCSLPEYNAILKQFNVLADRGKEEGRIFKNRGLIYRVLDAEGNKVGVPIKASDLHSKPTLDSLEKQFVLNQISKEAFKKDLKFTLDETLSLKPSSLKELMDLLQSKNVYTVIRRNNEGRIYGITFVDNNSKTVFNGSELGKAYSAGSLQTQILANEKDQKLNISPAADTPSKKQSNFPAKMIKADQRNQEKSMETFDALISAEKQFDGIPFQLLKKKRRRKKRSPGL